METLKNLNKLWRNSALLPSTASYYGDAADRVYNRKELLFDDDEEEDGKEEEESFFELELLMFNSKTSDKEYEGLRPTSNEVNNVNVGRRVVPVEPRLKPHPHSPVSILKSAPKFKVSLFSKNSSSSCPDLKLKQRPKVQEEEERDKVSTATISTLIRESSSSPVSKQSMSKCKTEDENDDSVSMDSSSSSKRFSKDVMQKYLKLKLIKPFHLKVAKSMNNINKSSRLFEMEDCSSSPAPSSSSPTTSSSSSSGYTYGLRVVCRQLGKSRSASSMMVVGSRRDESLMVEHDDGGIQSAILHCKKSFNSSRDSSVHSRSSSDQEPTIAI